MRAIQEIGINKTIRFIFYSLYCVFLDIVLFHPFKIVLLRLAGAEIGHDAVLNRIRFFNLYHAGFSNLKIGDYCFLGEDVMLDLADQIIIDNHVTVSNRALILTHSNVGYKNHPLQKHYPRVFKKVNIRSGSFIGAGAILLPGVTIYQGAMVGAGAVVTKDVAKNTVVVGSPAKFLKKLKD